ncbi:hypothetical protein P5F77_01975 [Caldifermentibacillus hisashii]|jgi:hypothetical protein|uniref:hypothetical protein n=1 Tax=Caldifermentibacillus hisashii TaxID=996558 RepID=UPI0030D69A01
MDYLIEIKEKSTQILTFWSSPIGWAPDSAADKLLVARLDWMKDLTNCLDIWNDKSIFLTDGELLLAWANLGALVEGWLKLFYCVYYEDYLRNPKLHKGKIIEPNNMRFEDLKQFSRGILWDKGSEWDNWVELIQHRRNAIHAFNDRNIGTPIEFAKNIQKYNIFIDIIDQRLPYPD